MFPLADERYRAQIDAERIVWSGQVLGREAFKPGCIGYDGMVVLDGDPLIPEDPTNKKYVDAQVVTLNDAIAAVVTQPGPAGADGTDGTNGLDGHDGAAGAAGPNNVTTSTTTNITGLLKGDGAHVGAAGQIDHVNLANIGTISHDWIDWYLTFDTNSIASGWVAVADAWSYASASTITVPSGAASKYSPGMRIQLTQTTVKYFIITAVANTLLTVYGGSTPYTVANADISAISYSTVKAPLGFPLDPAKWQILVAYGTTVSQATPTTGQWYNLGTTHSQITVPIGVWELSYQVCFGGNKTSAATWSGAVTLTSNNSSPPTETDTDLTCFVEIDGASGTSGSYIPCFRTKSVNLAAPTTYYLDAKTVNVGTVIYFVDTSQPMALRAVCAYL